MFGKPSPRLTEQDVLVALKGVKDPDIQRDLVDLGMIKDIRIGDGTLALTVNLTTPACPLKAKIESDVRGPWPGTSASRSGSPSTQRRRPRQGRHREGGHPRHQERHRRRVGQGGRRQVDDGRRHRLRPAILRRLGRPDGRRRLRPVDPPPGRRLGPPHGLGDRIQPIEASGLRLMSIGFLVEPERAVIMRGPMLHGIMQQFLHQVDWGQLDYLVIDLPPGTGDVPLTLAQTLPLTGAVVVCTPQEVALLDATRAVAMFRQLKVPLLGMIENMSFLDPPVGERMYPVRPRRRPAQGRADGRARSWGRSPWTSASASAATPA
jgi:ATP-binding protein involved in chromosome partitioning